MNIKERKTILYFLEQFLEKEAKQASEKEELIHLKETIRLVSKSITSATEFSFLEIEQFFNSVGLHTHYLVYKSSAIWDEYDRSNFKALLLKYRKAKEVFAIFTLDGEDGKYIIPTQPKFFFDTYEEAEKELCKLLQNDSCLDERQIMSLWQIQ